MRLRPCVVADICNRYLRVQFVKETMQRFSLVRGTKTNLDAFVEFRQEESGLQRQRLQNSIGGRPYLQDFGRAPASPMYGHAGNLDFDQVLQPFALEACLGSG